MSKYYLINIAGTGSGGAVSLWLTSDGTETGRPCKTVVNGIAGLLSPESGTTTVASDGTPYTEKPLTAGKGRPFELDSAFVPSDLYDDLKALIDYVVEQGTAIDIAGTGTAGDFDVSAIPNFVPVPIEFEGIGIDVIKGLKLKFIVAAVNS
jgi:hypothetical protein